MERKDSDREQVRMALADTVGDAQAETMLRHFDRVVQVYNRLGVPLVPPFRMTERYDNPISPRVFVATGGQYLKPPLTDGQRAMVDKLRPLADCNGTTVPRQEGDEYVCKDCLLRWDTHEERPPCLFKSATPYKGGSNGS